MKYVVTEEEKEIFYERYKELMSIKRNAEKNRPEDIMIAISIFAALSLPYFLPIPYILSYILSIILFSVFMYPYIKYGTDKTGLKDVVQADVVILLRIVKHEYNVGSVNCLTCVNKKTYREFIEYFPEFKGSWLKRFL